MPLYYAKKISRLPEESFEFGEGLDRSYTESYEVILDTENSTTLDVSGLQLYEALLLSPPSDADPLPQYGQKWVSRDGIRTDNLSIMRRVSGRRDRADKAKFFFSFMYSPRGRDDTPTPDKRDLAGGTDSLANLTPTWSITTEDKMETPEDGKDLDGKRVLNTAGDPFEPGIEFNYPIIVVNYSCIEPTAAWASAYDLLLSVDTYKYKTNSDIFLYTDPVFGGSDIDKWLITKYDLAPEYLGATRVIRRSMEFKYNPRGWTDRFLNAGLYELKNTASTVYVPGEGYVVNPATSNKKPIVNPTTRQPVTKPWPLDTNGQAITDPATTPPFSRTFRSKGKTAFAGLNVRLI